MMLPNDYYCALTADNFLSVLRQSNSVFLNISMQFPPMHTHAHTDTKTLCCLSVFVSVCVCVCVHRGELHRYIQEKIEMGYHVKYR